MQNYEQHDWSPYLWAGMLAGIITFTVLLGVLFIVMVQKAGEATRPPLSDRSRS